MTRRQDRAPLLTGSFLGCLGNFGLDFPEESVSVGGRISSSLLPRWVVVYWWPAGSKWLCYLAFVIGKVFTTCVFFFLYFSFFLYGYFPRAEMTHPP
jgi:hypothetical protein